MTSSKAARSGQGRKLPVGFPNFTPGLDPGLGQEGLSSWLRDKKIALDYVIKVRFRSLKWRESQQKRAGNGSLEKDVAPKPGPDPKKNSE